jgi:hypothetical protein
VDIEGTEDLRYFHALLIDPYLGLMDNLMQQTLWQFPKLLKASGEDPDTPQQHWQDHTELKFLCNSKSKNWSNMEHGQW